jgi:hypothetical protein
MELGKYCASGLPGPSVVAEERGMASPWIAVEFREGLDRSGPEGIQVQVADKLEEVRFFLYGHRLVPVLEEVPDAFVAPVKGAGISGEEAAHGSAERPGPSSHEEMSVV